MSAWIDAAATWRDELRRKVDAGQDDLSAELAEGAALLHIDIGDVDTALATTDTVVVSRAALTCPLTVTVEPEHAAFGAWYELFPRSFGGFDGVAKALPELVDLGFDVVYLPPIHPIGRTNRKGRNGALTATADDPGSPWAIGAAEGGHDAVHPDLGTIADFDRFVDRAASSGSRSHLISLCSARPTTRGWVSIPNGSRGGPTAPSSTPRTRPSATRTSSTSASRARCGVAVDGAARRGAALGRPRCAHLPGRQPAHQAVRVLGMADRRGARRSPRRGVPRRGVHASGGDEHARQARLQPVVHLLHLAQHPRRAHRISRAAEHPGRLVSSEFLRQHA